MAKSRFLRFTMMCGAAASPPIFLAILPAFAGAAPVGQTSGALWAFLAAMGVAALGVGGALLAVFSQRAVTAPEVVGRFLQAVLLVALAAVAMLLAALPVFADPAPVVCAHIDDALARLEARFGERPIWTGILGDGSSILTLTAAPDGSTWSALISAANGKACLAAAGTDWLLPGPPAAPAPAGEMN